MLWVQMAKSIEYIRSKGARALFMGLLGLVLVFTAGCLGGSRNFAPIGSAQAASAPSSGGSSTGPKIGSPAPDFTLKDLDGQMVTLSSMRGKIVLINFWATWCPPCKQEMPDLEKAYQKYREQGIVFLGVDQGESADTVRQFVRKNGYNWMFLLDSYLDVSKSYRASAIPMTFFVDSQGIIRDTQVGPLTLSSLETKLAKIRQ